jgi:hypothetical protein
VVINVNTPPVEIATVPMGEPFLLMVYVAVEVGFVPAVPAAPEKFPAKVTERVKVSSRTVADTPGCPTSEHTKSYGCEPTLGVAHLTPNACVESAIST